MKLDAERFPLYWPEHWPRTDKHKRERTTRYKVPFTQARDDLMRAAALLPARNVILSTNIPLRGDGLPRADIERIDDPGVAVYWVEGYGEKETSRVIACDHWTMVRDNLRALGLAVEALRALKRSGATQIVERAYAGFAALPADAGPTKHERPWREVLNLVGLKGPAFAVQAAVEASYKTLVRERHPDVGAGGSHEAIVELNRARADALREIAT